MHKLAITTVVMVVAVMMMTKIMTLMTMTMMMVVVAASDAPKSNTAKQMAILLRWSMASIGLACNIKAKTMKLKIPLPFALYKMQRQEVQTLLP